MKTRSFTPIFVSSFILLIFTITPSLAQHSADDFMGRWGLFLPDGAGWLNVHNDNGYLDADLLWRGGSVLPVANVYLAGDKLIVTRVGTVKRDGMRSHQVTQRYEFKRGFDELIGTAYLPRRNGSGQQVVSFKGKKLPPLPSAPMISKAKRGEPIALIGNSLKGWSLIEENSKNGWKVRDGVLTNDPKQPAGDDHHFRYGNLRTDATYKDFNLKLEVNVPEGSNSGVYLRGIYEIQVADTYGNDVDSHNMGALYSRVTPAEAAEKPAGQWQEMDITLYQHHVTVKLNGKTILDNAPVQGVTGGAMTADEFSAGPIFLQGDHGEVHYRNMVLTPITE